MNRPISISLLILLILTGCQNNSKSSTNPTSSTSIDKINRNIILDKKTNLMWLDTSNRDNLTMTFPQAYRYCKNLTINKYANWRVPTIEELYTIVDYNSSNPALKSEFKHISPNGYWSANSYQLDNNLIIGMNFNDGSDGVSRKTNLQHTICVRGDFSTNHSFSKENDIVLDTKTNIEWQDNNDTKNKFLTYEEANSYCKNLILSNKNNWRIPTLKELHSIVDRGNFMPSINQSFSNTNSRFYWTSTLYKDDNKKVWTILFTDGNDYQKIKDKKAYIRCVR